ncbi:MAG: hypothetical protein GIX03_14560 [Candidatus Eremiobacteraeota bacterium]|nr:hypothetical protein [Candidatus Eremiobacteraeota bacterium]MBC5804188.1 hypothetical protein [Candidatus Eremiobacteraeota bacterium]MBC5822612.1 hypothetical protein [Candidatus Eremiobacteraeota bacterium]
MEAEAIDARRRAENLERTLLALRDAREAGDMLAIVARGIARDFGRRCAAFEVRNGRLRPVAGADSSLGPSIDEGDVDLDALRHRIIMRSGEVDLVAVAFDGQLRAVLALSHAHERLPEEDVKHLRTIAGHAALALSNALAFEALRRYAAEGAALTEAARTILGFNELEPLADALCRLGVRLGLATRAAFYGRRGERLARIAFVATTGDVEELPQTLPLDSLVARTVLAASLTGEAFFASRVLLRVDEDGARHEGLFVLTRSLPFERPDQRLSEALVTLAALAIRNVELYEQSTRAYRALAESNAFKDDLMAMFAHDFKGPLTVISGFSELLLETDNDEVRRSAQTILAQTHRLAKLSEDALALAATQSAGFSLQRTVSDVVQFVRESLAPMDRSGRIIVEAPDEAVAVEFDRARLRHVLDNVVGNALKYSPAAVRVNVTLQPAGAGRNRDEVRIDVADHGIGIPQADLDRIFTRFGRAANARSRGVAGSGVGLYVAKKIVDVHGGRLEVRSVENEGSTFSIVLPSAQTGDTSPGE